MMNNKKIMMLCTTDNMIWQFLIPHIKHLQDMGNTVECVCAKTGFWFDELKDKYGFIMHEFDFARSPLSFKNVKVYKKLKKFQEDHKFDVIYCQQPVGGLMGRLIAKKFKAPCIYTAHGFHFFKGNSTIKNIIFRTVEKKLAKYTTALITINQEDYDACKNWKAKHIYKINGIGFDKNKYTNELIERDKMRNQLGLKDEFTILTVAEFIKRKNYDTMLKTIAQLKDQNIKFLVCGTGRDKDSIEQQIKDLEITNKVELLGYRKDINNIMNASDCFFLASHQEGLTLSIIEALNFGLPVITSNVRGNQDLVENGKGGFICEQDDHIAFADAINKIMIDDELKLLMSQENKRISVDYAIETVVAQLKKIYEEI